jgi:hypothetical protein
MFCQATFDSWRSTIMTYLPHLSKSQAIGLDLWSLDMILRKGFSWGMGIVLGEADPTFCTAHRKKPAAFAPPS